MDLRELQRKKLFPFLPKGRAQERFLFDQGLPAPILGPRVQVAHQEPQDSRGAKGPGRAPGCCSSALGLQLISLFS